MINLSNLTSQQIQQVEQKIANYYTKTLKETDIKTSIQGKKIIVDFESLGGKSEFELSNFHTLRDLQKEMTTDVLFVFLHRDVVMKTKGLEKTFIGYSKDVIKFYWNDETKGEESVSGFVQIKDNKYTLDVPMIIQKDLALRPIFRGKSVEISAKPIEIPGLELDVDGQEFK